MPSRPRPLLVTLLSIGVLIFAAIYLTRLAMGMRLPDLPFQVPRWYVPASGGIWGVSGLAAAYGLLKRHAWGAWLARWGAVAFALWYWADRVFLSSTDYTQRNLPFALALTLAGLAAIFWALSRPSSQEYFQENAS